MASPPAGRVGFTLLWTSQTFAEFAYSTAVIVLPLLALAITGSPYQAGVIGFVDALALLLAGLPAGAIADRYDRRVVMLWCEAAQMTAFGCLALSLWTGTASFTALLLLALVNGAATAVALAAFYAWPQRHDQRLQRRGRRPGALRLASFRQQQRNPAR
ncbi:MFS transporter [Streptomyces brasiliscabiei]|uniref:MFS transporter n=1 Tax=Streptomyces brasiliscabiei TaxID=2736302 RepID=A0ABU8GN02_9ACTN